VTGQRTLGITFASFGNTLRRCLRVWLESRHGQRSKRVESFLFPPVRAERPLAKHRPEISARRRFASHRGREFFCAPDRSTPNGLDRPTAEISRDRIRVGRFPQAGKRCFGLNPPSPSWGGHKARGEAAASRGFIYQSPSVSAKSLLQDARVARSLFAKSFPEHAKLSRRQLRMGSLKSIARSVVVMGLQRPSPQAAATCRPGPVGGRSGACRGGI
jgi:hypothetical protein